MKRTLFGLAVFAFVFATFSGRSSAFEAIAIKEASGSSAGSANGPCPLAANLNGTCANLRYYNICSGYIWFFSGIPVNDGFGTRFDGACVANGSHLVKRSITYFRGTVPGYSQTVDVYLDRDTNNDGCPNGVVATDLNLDPGERWNCSNFHVCVPVNAGQSLIVRSVKRGSNAPSWSTEGPYTSICDPIGLARSFYYPATGGCLPWIVNSPTGRNDNFLTYLILDNEPYCACCPTEPTSWGHVKGLYQ